MVYNLNFFKKKSSVLVYSRLVKNKDEKAFFNRITKAT